MGLNFGANQILQAKTKDRNFKTESWEKFCLSGQGIIKNLEIFWSSVSAKPSFHLPDWNKPKIGKLFCWLRTQQWQQQQT